MKELFKPMKVPTYILLLISLSWNLIVMAQPIQIQTDSVPGSPLTVRFSYTLATAVSVQWDFGDGTTDNISSPLHTFERAGNYTIKLKINDLDTTQMNIQVGKVYSKNSQMSAASQAADSIIVPNVFTPNDDSINDEFEVSSSGNYILSLKVFTRAGIMIYKTQAKTIKWDGRLDSGEKVLPGIYYYIIETIEVTPPVKKTGFVYIFE